MENSREELTKFKTDINLVDFCLQHKFDHKKGFKDKSAANTHIVVENEHDTLIIRINPANSEYIYFNPKNSRDKGSIIDFCSNHLNLNVGQTRKYLRPYIGQTINTNKGTALKAAPPLKQSTINEKYFEVKPLTDTSYLTDRGILEPILNSSLFNGTIGNKIIEFEDKKNNVIIKYNNTAFLIKDLTDKTIGLSLKNKTATSSYKGNLEESSTRGMWISNIPKNDNPTIFAIAENPIDCISHYQMNFNPLNTNVNVVYFASNGTLRRDHIEFVQHYINKQRPEQILLINDNDHAGMRYNITLLGNLKSPGVSSERYVFYPNEDVNISCYYAKPLNVLEIDIYNSKGINHEEIVSNAKEFFHQQNEEIYKDLAYKREEFFIEDIVQTDALTKIKVTFDNRKELLLKGMEITQLIRPVPVLSVSLPKDKDYNQDLQNLIKSERNQSAELGA